MNRSSRMVLTVDLCWEGLFWQSVTFSSWTGWAVQTRRNEVVKAPAKVFRQEFWHVSALLNYFNGIELVDHYLSWCGWSWCLFVYGCNMYVHSCLKLCVDAACMCVHVWREHSSSLRGFLWSLRVWKYCENDTPFLRPWKSVNNVTEVFDSLWILISCVKMMASEVLTDREGLARLIHSLSFV